MSENPFETPREQAPKSAAETSWGVRLGHVGYSIVSLISAGVSGFMLLFRLGVSNMLPSTIRGVERARAVAQNVLFGEGPLQIVYVGFLLLIFYASVGNFVYLLWTVWFGGSLSKKAHTLILLGSLSMAFCSIAVVYLLSLS